MAVTLKITNNKDTQEWPLLTNPGDRTTGALTATTTYTLTATSDSGQTKTANATVTVESAPVIDSFTVNGAATAAIFANTATNVTFAWETTGATSVTISPSLGGASLSVDGNRVTALTLASNQTYTLTATSALGQTTTATVTVYADAEPSITFAANPTAIVTGGANGGASSSTLSWTVTNASTVSINQSIGSKPLTGNQSVSPSSNTTYTLTATTSHGLTKTATATVTVESALSIDQFIANPATIAPGGSSTLEWTVTGG